MQIINFYKKNRRKIWKPSGEWSYFAGNVLVALWQFKMYLFIKKKKKCIYPFSSLV